MTLETLTAVFGWMTVLNFGLLAISSLCLLAMRETIIKIHTRIMGMEEDDLNRAYLAWMSNHKLLTLVFCLVPYIALRFAA
jgi:hypothetical protein